MLQLRLVKSKEAREEEEQQTDAEGNVLLHGTKVLLELIQPWMYQERLVCADSYFASVGAAIELRNRQMKFIGVVKTATKRFPMAYLSSVELQDRGDRFGLISKDANGKPSMLAFVWMDRERRYFIATGSSLQEGTPYFRDRWRQVDKDDTEADPEKVQVVVPQPKAAKCYYSCCSKIDQHNRDRQDTLGIEQKLWTHDWSFCVNMSILSLCFVDS